jgi:hypothetical protein
MSERIDKFALNPFLDGPVEFLVKACCEELSKVKQFKLIFGEFIDPYKRMDYGIRNAPMMRVYNLSANKTSDNAWIQGDIIADVIFPPAIRRNETQQLPDTIAAALFQQFRRTPFFSAMREKVPALNEFGRIIVVDKSLGFMLGENIVPLTQFTINFKLDLRIWDDYLTDHGRTVDDPFEVTLKDLEKIINTIAGVTGESASPVSVSLQAIADDLTEGE